MKLAYLTEVAALMAAHSELFLDQSQELPNQTIGDYYILSRNRFNRWMRDLTDLENGLSIRDPLHLVGLMPHRSATRCLTEQILINEMVARIWTTLVVARDKAHNSDRTVPVAHNIFLGHLSVRHKALSSCLADDRMSPQDLISIDKLRASTERWSDLLCCHLMDRFGLWHYAFDEERAKEYLRDRADQRSLSQNSQSWVLILAGMRHSFPDNDGLAATIHEDDRAITRLMLSSFPEDTPEMAFWMGNRMRQARIS
ncbi:MAG: hypothetical protein JNL58_20435 [Planctomyces sp.]|nr:hypothetical protein [Planctomyces sp.]